MALEDQLAALTEAIAALTSDLENQTKTILRGTSEGVETPQKTPKKETAPTAVPETPAVVKVEVVEAEPPEKAENVPAPNPETFYKESLAPAFTELVTKNRTAAVRILADFGIAKLVAAPVASYNDIYHAVQEAITNG